MGLAFDSLVAIGGDAAAVANALARLIDLHVVEGSGDFFCLSRPLRVAVERDSRFKVTLAETNKILRVITNSLQITEAGDAMVSVSLVEASVLAQFIEALGIAEEKCQTKLEELGYNP